MQVIPRQDNIKPFLLLDGHGSRLEFPFLKYINTPEDHWVVCLGVPYGTALWQVGDSKEQNGSFNIAITKAKQQLLEFRESKCLSAKLQSTYLIPLINKAWANSFARVSKNKYAICDRGWNTLNKILLTIPEIRATMTDEERRKEEISDSIILPNRFSDADTETNTVFVTAIADSSDNHSIASSLNYSKGTSAFCLGVILKQEQLMEAREKINMEKLEGKTLVEKLKEAKRVTAGICYKIGTSRLGKDVFAVSKESVENKKLALINKMNEDEKTYLKLKKDADELMSMNKPVEKLNNKELNTLLKSLRRKGDSSLPTRKNDMIMTYNNWKNREPLTFDYENTIEHADEKNDVDMTGNFLMV